MFLTVKNFYQPYRWNDLFSSWDDLFYSKGIGDVQEHEKSYEVSLPVPGARREDFTLSLEQNGKVLKVSYVNKDNKNKHCASFTNSYSVNVNSEKDIEASYDAGVLSVRIKKAEIKKIPITTVNVR